MFDDNITTSSEFDLEVQNHFKILHIMHWLPKVCKTPTEATFVVASKKCSAEALSKAITKSLELIFKQIKSLHENSHCYSDYKKFWVV